MKSQTVHTLEPQDRKFDYVEEALHRLFSFRDLPDQETEKALRRLLSGQFSTGDCQAVITYLGTVASRAHLRWGVGTEADKATPDVGSSIRQAAAHAHDVAKQVREQYAQMRSAQ